jgi:hypothetical protein
MKNYFHIKENTLQLQIKQWVNEQRMVNSQELAMLTRDLVILYARLFTNDNTARARHQLIRQTTQIRKPDAVRMAFCTGLILATSTGLCYALWEESENDEWLVQLSAATPIYLSTLVAIYIVAAAGFCIQIFKRFQINYSFIFELDKSHELIHHQLYTCALGLFAIWLFCLTGQIYVYKVE